METTDCSSRKKLEPWHIRVRPPSHGDSYDAHHPTWILLDVRAYIDDRQNETTAFVELSNGHQIQVTFCTASPPLVSYICVWCPTGLDPVELFRSSPTVEAVNADLVLIRINARPVEYLVYQARGPSLTLLEKRVKRPYCYLPEPYNIALLPHGGGLGFKICTLDSDFTRDASNFNLCVFDSVSRKWNRQPLCLDQLNNPPDDEMLHVTEKVVYLGEQAIAFVDLWRGMVICNELGNRTGSYVPLPEEMIQLERARGSHNTRDVAVIGGRLTAVRLRTCFYSDLGWCWDLCTWSKPVACLDEEDWREDFKLHSCDLLVDEETRNIELLPTLPDRPPTAKLNVALPTICLTDANVIYIMGKVRPSDHKAVVLTVNVANRRLLEVSVYDAERIITFFDFSYTQSTISQYFTNSSGVNKNLKRPGVIPASYPRKKQAGNEPLQLDTGRDSETEDGDAMVLE
uniref:DUF1618 domain-containing protein n=1 Tax=Leersia perrieri TaxID=77586 RepID=A0A0D9XGI3_9ORYZ